MSRHNPSRIRAHARDTARDLHHTGELLAAYSFYWFITSIHHAVSITHEALKQHNQQRNNSQVSHK